MDLLESNYRLGPLFQAPLGFGASSESLIVLISHVRSLEYLSDGLCKSDMSPKCRGQR